MHLTYKPTNRTADFNFNLYMIDIMESDTRSLPKASFRTQNQASSGCNVGFGFGAGGTCGESALMSAQNMA